MGFMKTNYALIKVGENIWNTLKDFGLAIENTDYAGDPVQDTSNMVFVPGRPGPLELDAVFGPDASFMYRSVLVKFGGIRKPEQWDKTISMFRNLFEGRNISIEFGTDLGWYYAGRCSIVAFNHQRALGTFELHIDYAYPYKMRDHVVNVHSSAAGTTVYLENSRLNVYPVITTSAAITVQLGDTTVSLDAGTHKNTAIMLSGCQNEMIITGDADVTIEYTEGSL